MRTTGALLSFILMVALSGPAGAHHETQHQLPPVLREVGFDQRLGEVIPLDLRFQDEAGQTVRLGDYFGTRPVILTMAYYECPRLCGLVLDGLAQSLRGLRLNMGEAFVVVTVSIDPGDTPTQAAAKKGQLLRQDAHSSVPEGWHFLSGEAASIRQLTAAVGFRYAVDVENGQFAHAAGLVVLTPAGAIARYLYGIEFAPKDVRLALIEAAAGQIGSAVDQLLLFCYRYDPTTGRYGLVIMNVLRLAGLVTVAGLGGFIAIMFCRERQRGQTSRVGGA